MQVGRFQGLDSGDRDAIHRAFLQMWPDVASDVEGAWREAGPTSPKSPLYHYTTARGIRGIVADGAIYLTDAFYLNDKAELSYGRDLAAEVLADRAGKATALLRSFFEERMVPFDAFGEQGGFEAAFYVASFCQRSDLLSQWRAYGGGGAGYALGFDVVHFNDREYFADQKAPLAILHRIEYERGTQRKLVAFVVDRCSAQLASDLSVAANAHERRILEAGWYALLAVQLAGLFPQFKHPMFREEQEWRLTLSRVPPEEKGLLSYREVGSDLVPYILYPLRMRDTGLLPLQEIVLAPASEPKLQRRTIAKFLRDNNYPSGVVRIVEPEIPLQLRK